MNKLRFISILCILPVFLSGNAQNFNITREADGYTVEIEINDLNFIKGNYDDSIPVVTNATGIFERGAPALPKYSNSFPVKSYVGYKYEVIEDQWSDLPASVAPSLGFTYQNTDPGERIKGEIYSYDAFYPEINVRLFPVHSIKNTLAQAAWFFPLQYNPQRKILRVHSYMKLRLTSELVISSKLLSKGAEFQSERMLIVTPDSFRSDLVPFIHWKNQKGIEVYLLSSDSFATAGEIKAAVKKYYSNYNISYLLLVGDNGQTPAINSVYGPSDYSYGLLDGTDNYADINIGRFPARSRTDLISILKKSISYEKTSTPAEWLKHFSGLASDENNGGDNDESDLEHILRIEQLFKNNSFSSEVVYEGTAGSNSVSSLINRGCGYLFYIGHGNQKAWSSISFSTDSFANLHNYNMNPFIVDGACLNGDLTYPICLAEKFMCASDNYGAKGSVAMLASTISQLWAPPMLGQDIIAQLLFNPVNGTINTTIGEICNQAFSGIINTYFTGGIETAYTWMLYGDPSLKLWTATPSLIEVSVPEVFDIAKDTFTVYGPDSAMVSIMSDGVLLDAGIITSGKVDLTKGNNLLSDSVIVTVSKQNYKPEIRILAPYSDGSSYYNINSVIISDENNNLPENEEWVDIKPVITNYGLLTGKKVKIEVYSHDPFIEFNKPEVTIDKIAAKSTDTIQGLKLRSLTALPDGTNSKIVLKISDSAGMVNFREFGITFYAPVVNLVDILINGKSFTATNIAVTTDTVMISCIFKNSGHVSISDIRASLNLKDFMINFLSDSVSVFPIDSQSTDTASFLLKVNSNCIIGWKFNGNLFVKDASLMPYRYSFFYKTIPVISIAKGELTVDEFPFYNYYKANRSQFIYKADEMGNASMLIDSIAFNVDFVPADARKHIFSNLKISVGEVSSVSYVNSFISSDSLSPVFVQTTYQMPEKPGWFYIDINDYLYSGTKNLLIEVDWGINTLNTGYNDSYKVVGHISATESAGFGYNDFTAPAPWTNSSNVKPDIIFSGKLNRLNNVYLNYKSADNITFSDTAYIKIGEKWVSLPFGDSVLVKLPEGKYSYVLSLEFDGDEIQNGEFTIQDDNQVIPIFIDNIVKACGSYTWNNVVYDESGTFKQNLVSSDGSDSIATLNLLIIKPEISYKLENSKITLLKHYSSAQIYDCDLKVAFLDIDSTFSAVQSGNYAVIINQYGCKDTSECMNIAVTGIETERKFLSIYPNPAKDKVSIKFPKHVSTAVLKTYNMNGKLIHELRNINNEEIYLDLSLYAKGTYIVELQNDGIILHRLLIVQ